MFSIVDGRICEAKWYPSPNYGARPEGGAGVISLLVIHNISLPPGQYGGGYVEQFFMNTLKANEHPYFASICELTVSSHVFIDRQGQLVQFVNLNDRAWHAGVSCYGGRDNCNDFSIGIELEGTDTSDYSDAQYHSLIKLTQAIMRAYPEIIPKRITGHEHIAPRRKTDPGRFDWRRLFQALMRG